jgi:hypothetical protein
VVDLYSCLEAMRFTRDPESRERLAQQARKACDDLAVLREYSVAHTVRWMYFDQVGDSVKAIEEAQQVTKNGGDCFLRGSSAALLYRHGRYDEAIQVLQSGQVGESADDFEAEILGVLLALTPNGQAQAREIYRSLIARANPQRPWADRTTRLAVPEMILMFVGDEGMAKTCQARLDSGNCTLWQRSLLEFVIGKIGPEDLVKRAASRFQQSTAFLVIGLQCLSNGRRSEAMIRLRKCRECLWFGPEGYWAAALLARMEKEPLWPPFGTPASKAAVSK